MTSPVCLVLLGSNNNNQTSSSAIGLCSIPFGTTNISPSFNSIILLENLIFKVPLTIKITLKGTIKGTLKVTFKGTLKQL